MLCPLGGGTMRRPHEPKIAAAAGLALLVLIFNAVLSYRATRRVIQYGDELSHTREALMELEETRSVLIDAEAAERGYLISGKKTDLEVYWSDVEEIDGRLNRLEAMVPNPTLQRGMPDLRTAVNNDLGRLERAIGLRRRLALGSAAPVALRDGSKRGLDQAGRIIGRMEADEQGELFQGARRTMASGRTAILSLSADKLFAITFLSLVCLVATRLLSERRRNEARIKEQREWFRVTLSSIGDAVIATDTAERITFMNSVAQAVTGWDPQEAVGKPLGAVLNVVDEETHEAVECCPEKVMRDGMTLGMANEAILISRNCREVPVYASRAPIRE